MNVVNLDPGPVSEGQTGVEEKRCGCNGRVFPRDL